jgi:hypothetical protein
MSSEGGAQWAGTFDCAKCGRKRLIGAEFSAAQRAKEKPVCLACTSAASSAEAAAAAAGGAQPLMRCAACGEQRPVSKTQAAKGDKARCAPCLEAATAAEAGAARAKLEADLEAARAAARAAEAAGAPQLERLRLASIESALEAQLVTGLKAKIGGGGGGGGGSWRGGRGGRR